MARSLANGVYTTRFARRKSWRFDNSLFQSIVDSVTGFHSIIDLGAGIGHYVRALRASGFDAIGVDGIDNISAISNGLVYQADLAQSQTIKPCDWAISIEVGEHIPATAADTFLDNLSNAALHGIIVSWAVPGQRGTNHVNCQTPDAIRSQLERRGWTLDETATAHARNVAGRPWNSKLLVLRRPDSVRQAEHN